MIGRREWSQVGWWSSFVLSVSLLFIFIIGVKGNYCRYWLQYVILYIYIFVVCLDGMPASDANNSMIASCTSAQGDSSENKECDWYILPVLEVHDPSLVLALSPRESCAFPLVIPRFDYWWAFGGDAMRWAKLLGHLGGPRDLQGRDSM